MTTDTDRGPNLTLARVHLRLGALALARAELEMLASQDGLDEDGLLDLAEVRWRTGDLVGAGEAATAVLERDRAEVIALVVAAEAAAAQGRPSEARQLAAQALDATGGDIDPAFAGMPRAAIWPADPAAPPPAPTTLFDAPPSTVAAPSETPRVAADSTDDVPTALPVAMIAGAPDPMRLWDLPDDPTPGDPELPSAESELEAGRAALASGDVAAATMHLALTLRLGPALAPLVLDAVGDRPDRGLALVRGDAYRLVGREADARRAFADAAATDRRGVDGGPAETETSPVGPDVPSTSVSPPDEIDPPDDVHDGLDRPVEEPSDQRPPTPQGDPW